MTERDVQHRYGGNNTGFWNTDSFTGGNNVGFFNAGGDYPFTEGNSGFANSGTGESSFFDP